MSAWRDHRADVAAVLLHEEFLGLSSTYRSIAAANHVSHAVRRDWEIAANQGRTFVPQLPDGALYERHLTLLVVEQIGIPCVKWLAEGKLPFFKRRRVGGVTLTPYPEEKCRCGHRWDCHRWTWGRRRFRIRWRKSRARSVAHECNVVDCGCGRFPWSEAKRWQRPLRRIYLLPQAPFIGMNDPPPEPQLDTSIPDSAQPGTVVTLEEHAAMEARSAETRGGEAVWVEAGRVSRTPLARVALT